MKNWLKQTLIFIIVIIGLGCLVKISDNEQNREISKEEYVMLLTYPKEIIKPYLEKNKISQKDLAEIKETYFFKFKKEKETHTLEDIKKELGF